jgi:tripartite-type tricarboxylate transporter receptor subunit TctC
MGHVMNRSRRKFLRPTAGAAALPAMPHVALALDYPTRPVHWIISTAPGDGAADILARLMGAWLSERAF